ncbi:MAG: serine/threonine-protein kinase [Planctomycetaceae bacterium]
MNDLSRVKALFLEAIEHHKPEDWPAFLEAACGEDQPLRDSVQRILDAHCASLLAESRHDTVIAAPGLPFDESFTMDVDPDARLSTVGHFRLVRLVGRGGMGNVFYAMDEQLQRPVAVKLPRLDVIGNPSLRQRFLREAQLAAGLNHPGLVAIYDFGVTDQVCYLVSNWCSEGDLAGWLSKHPGPQNPHSVAEFMRHLCEAVSFCHRSGVLHLDIKPGNILLSGALDHLPGQPLLTDFGLARVIEQGLNETHSSLMLGTPLYMAPEQAACRSEEIGPWTDVFALGVVMYEMLTGERPFSGDNAVEVMDQVRSDRIIQLPNRLKIPKELQLVCRTCLERHPADRYQSVQDLLDDLRRFLNGDPVTIRPVTRRRRVRHAVCKPERIRQAGLVTVAIQIPMIVLMLALWAMMAFGLASTMPRGWSAAALPFLIILLSIHVPSLLVGVRALRYEWWAVPAGLLFSLAFLIPTSLITIGAAEPMELYRGQPLAAFLVHYCFAAFAMFQTLACVVALPAAWCLRRKNLKS